MWFESWREQPCPLFNSYHLVLMEEPYHFREDFRFWHLYDRMVVEQVSNSAVNAGHTGAGCVACFVRQRLAEMNRA